MKIISKNPSKNFEVLAEFEETTETEVLQKIKTARAAAAGWKALGLNRRLQILGGLCEKFAENSAQIANLISLEMGKPLAQSEVEVARALAFMRWDLENAGKYLAPEITFESDKEIHEVSYVPKGVVLSITPFNFPFSQFVWQTFQNLVVGNVVVNKPDPNTPQVYKLLEKIIGESDLPKGVQQFVYGGAEIGSFLAEQDINMICFTGNTKTGQYLYKVAAAKMIPILMELGGSAPGIILADADIDGIIEKVFQNRFSNCGQVCHALKRLIVHESKFEEVVEKLTKLAGKQVIGDALDSRTTLGPLVSQKQLKVLNEQFDDAIQKGARAIFGGKRPEELSGGFFPPTLLTGVSRDMRVWKEEVFGPILPIVSFKSLSEAIELANDTIYGLGAYIYTANKDTFNDISEKVESCMVSHNGLVYLSAFNPFGGIKASGNGRVRGKWGLRELCDVKVSAAAK
jgi:acyl-CoA reductase-like NAD-dependent aldehyde dehydrogenase